MRRQPPSNQGISESEVFLPTFHEDLLKQIDPNARLSSDSTMILREVAHDFLKDLTIKSIQLARNRKSDTLEPSDVHHCLHNVFGLDLPGFETVTSPAHPSSEYLDQFEAVQSFLAQKTDD